jgi:hypothetical protein
METKPGDLFVGAYVDDSGDRDETLIIDAPDLTTHGVIVGMTGSGKTGLAIGLLEEALISGVPCLVIDPKGDMGNLLLNFPDFLPTDFRPWIDESAARREGLSPDELAARTAGQWRDGLASWNIDGERLRRLKEAAQITIYTPGSQSGIPINVLGNLTAPPAGTDIEAIRAEIEGLVSSLLVLAGIESDPISGPEHILLANLIEAAWMGGRSLDLAGLIGSIPKPPFRKLGVFEIDAFFPEKQRMALAMRLNGLIASPSFAAWMTGQPLSIPDLLTKGGPRGAILYLAHLSDTERQFFVTLLLSKVVTWTRGLAGSSDLRALIYMDEVFGFCPPTAEPPSKKPLLTLAKQARAFGVGMVLATQNPVDLDYKVMSNAGTWMIGRLQTERDKARILEALESAKGDTALGELDKRISALEKRHFLLHTTRGKPARVFTSRWAMSYLAGPLTKDQVGRLKMPSEKVPPAPKASAGAEPATLEPTEPPAPAMTSDHVPIAPKVAPAVPMAYLDPTATWAALVQAAPGGNYFRPIAAATVHLLYDDTPAAINHAEVYEAVIDPLGETWDEGAVKTVDHDLRDFSSAPPQSGRAYELPDAPIDQAAFWKTMSSNLVAHLVNQRRLQIWKNPGLKLYSRVGELESEFRARCIDVAGDQADNAIAALRDKYRVRIDRARDQVAVARRRAEELSADVGARKQEEIMSGAGDLLGALLGGRRRSTVSRAATRRSQTKRAEVRLDTAEGAVDDKLTALTDLESDLADDVVAITTQFDDKAALIEEVEIPLEKVDVKVADLRLVWVPTRP